MSWLPHLNDYGEICDCSGTGVSCDGEFLPCYFGNHLAAEEYKKFSWMIPHVKQYNSLKRQGLNFEAESIKRSVLG